MATDYKDTLFLPQSSFPMRGNLPTREPETLARWKAMNLHQKMHDLNKGKTPFILHDGPPYANGDIHIGHALNKILKDVVNRTQHMSGKNVTFIPVWDCHGLPIEWKIEEQYRKKGQQKEDVPLLDFRAECRRFAQKWVDIQKEEFEKLGLYGFWHDPQVTMSYKAEAAVVKEIGKFLMNGSLYKGVKPIQWSVVEKTALAEAEVDYKDKVSPAIYVKFPVTKTEHVILENAFVVIWTTTPWTLPGNRAVAFGGDIDYVVVDVQHEGGPTFRIVVAGERLDSVLAECNLTLLKRVVTFKGDELSGVTCAHPLQKSGYTFEVPLLPADHVTTDAGTGFVHTAPGHGLEDFQVGQKFGLEVPQTVGPDGVFYAHVPLLAGHHVFKADAVVIEALTAQETLMGHREITHSYPHSWRSKAPLIFRTTAQWFISMNKNGLRDKALSEIEKVQWFPAQSRHRIEAMVKDRPDWCLSRQRAWGTPLTLFVSKETGEPLRDDKVMDRIVRIIEEEGGDAWFSRDPADFLGDEYRVQDYEQVTDILDVWFDSGSTHGFVLEDHPLLQAPADLYLEGSDQHRGWFQTSLLVSCGTRGRAPYKQVLTHGFVMDEHGKKMSKSAGDALAPAVIAKEMGTEILRLWAVGSDYCDDLNISKGILKHHQDIYRRFRNTFRYLIGALSGFEEEERIDFKEMPDLERWILHRLYQLDELRKTCSATYDFRTFLTHLHTFCATDLSAFYFDIRKDSLYCDETSSLKRRSLRTVFDHLFKCLTTWTAPVLCFTAEEAWWARASQGPQQPETSVHLQSYPNLPKAWENQDLDAAVRKKRDLRSVLTGALEKMRASGEIGSSLQAHLTVYDPEGSCAQDMDWAEFSIASSVQILQESIPADAFTLENCNIGVAGQKAEGDKCARCWRVTTEVKPEAGIEVCQRCSDVVKMVAG